MKGYLMNNEFEKIINEYDNIVIGAGAGLSSAAGFVYGGKVFMDNFKYMYDEYGYKDMYSAGFHHFDTLEEKWAYWSKMIYLNRYKYQALDLYKRLYNLIKNKNYFVITTNVDHQFQLAGFDKKRLFYMQGDYGLFQCSRPCRNVTYDNKDMIINMINNTKNHKIPKELIPKCPICGAVMTTNLRCDDKFVEDDGFLLAKNRYVSFINEYKNKKILYLELGVGFSTPVWIKYPFMKLTMEYDNAKYVCVDNGYIEIPTELKKKSIIFNEDINNII